MKLHLDCRHFRGEKPCAFACSCSGCTHYEPMGTRILIIKLDAIGDVARTTTILKPLRKKYDPCHITWLTGPDAAGMLKKNSAIDQVLPYCAESLEPLRIQHFDVVLSLDKTPRAAAVAMSANADEKLGFGLSEFGTVFPLTPEAEYAFELGLDDDLKFVRNTRTYQDVIFECIRLPYNKDEYCIEIGDSARGFADDLIAAQGIKPNDIVIGLNLGGGNAFAHKMWRSSEAIEFLQALQEEIPNKTLLFGAGRERRTVEAIMEAGIENVFRTGSNNTIPQFQALLGKCAVVVTGDSLGMHLAIAEKRPVVTLFGPTCPQEIEFYGRGEAIRSALSCQPCYRSKCDRNPNCMQAIDQREVLAAVKRWLGK